MRLSVVIPCYNEETRLPAALAAALPHLETFLPDLELILVDDGSRDSTLELLRRLQVEHPFVQALALPRNRGKGRAVAEGVARTTGEVVLVTDADFSAPIVELGKLTAAIAAGAEVAIGSRAVPGAREIDQPLHRVLMGKAFNVVVQTLLLPGLKDTQCGFKLFRGESARSLFAGLTTDGFAFDVEVLFRARRRGLTVVEVPVTWRNSDSSRVAPLRHSTQMLRDVVKLRLKG